MIDLIGNIFGKAMISEGIKRGIGMAFGETSRQSKSSISPPSFSSAYVTDSDYESSPGQAEDIDVTDPNVMKNIWNQRLFAGENSYTKITLPTLK
tara:strand:+ start:710 stop:994 length:285 start_codon:yes stop_codon:yes gene_type:complete